MLLILSPHSSLLSHRCLLVFLPSLDPRGCFFLGVPSAHGCPTEFHSQPLVFLLDGTDCNHSFCPSGPKFFSLAQTVLSCIPACPLPIGHLHVCDPVTPPIPLFQDESLSSPFSRGTQPRDTSAPPISQPDTRGLLCSPLLSPSGVCPPVLSPPCPLLFSNPPPPPQF